MGIFGKIISIAGTGIFTLFLLIFRWYVGKHVRPWLDSAMKLNIAQALLQIADDVTDYLVQKNPNASWDDRLDQIVDVLIEVCGVKKSVAERVAGATIQRKQNAH